MVNGESLAVQVSIIKLSGAWLGFSQKTNSAKAAVLVPNSGPRSKERGN